MYNLFPQLGYFSASGLSGVGGSAEIQKTGSPHRKLKSDYKIQLFLSELQLIEINTYICMACFPWDISLTYSIDLSIKILQWQQLRCSAEIFRGLVNNFHVSKPSWALDLCRSRSHSVGNLLFNGNFSEVCLFPLWKGPIKSERNWSQWLNKSNYRNSQSLDQCVSDTDI